MLAYHPNNVPKALENQNFGVFDNPCSDFAVEFSRTYMVCSEFLSALPFMSYKNQERTQGTVISFSASSLCKPKSSSHTHPASYLYLFIIK